MCFCFCAAPAVKPHTARRGRLYEPALVPPAPIRSQRGAQAMADACHTSAFSQRFTSLLSLIGRGSGIAAAQAAIAAKKKRRGRRAL